METPDKRSIEELLECNQRQAQGFEAIEKAMRLPEREDMYEDGHGEYTLEELAKHAGAITEELAAARADARRLDYLDRLNQATNERNGTVYGWKLDTNHNRTALTDHNLPHMTVREAIDAAMAANPAT